MEGRVWQALADSSRGPEISPGGRGVCVLCRRERTYRPYLQKDSSFSVIELVTPCEICSDLYHTGWLWLSPLSETLKTGFHSLIFLPSTRQQHHMIERREIENNLELRQKQYYIHIMMFKCVLFHNPAATGSLIWTGPVGRALTADRDGSESAVTLTQRAYYPQTHDNSCLVPAQRLGHSCT